MFALFGQRRCRNKSVTFGRPHPPFHSFLDWWVSVLAIHFFLRLDA